MTPNFDIRAATAGDLPAIAAIQQASPEASTWEPLDYDCFVVTRDGEVAGFLVTRQTAPGECEILNLAVHPSFRRRGIARMLVNQTLRAAPGEWFLEVRESNIAGIFFYRSLGFDSVGRRENYYNNPSEAAIVMRFFS